MAVVLLVRHGQASFGAEDYDVLSELGERQSAVVGERLARLERLDRVVHGGMRRQADTARIAMEPRTGAPEPVVDLRWAEYDHEAMLRLAVPTEADQERFGRELAAADDPRRAFQEHFEQAVTRWTGARDSDDYPETFGAFSARVGEGFSALLADTGRSQTAVVFTSGGVISALCAELLGLDADRWAALNRVVVNTSVTKIVHGRSGTNLIAVNDHAHLEHDPGLITYR
jgi:broad specificity phosphatase PhoE